MEPPTEPEPEPRPEPRKLDLAAAARFLAIGALLAAAWVAVRLLKPKDTELSPINSRSAAFGDMSSAAQQRSRGKSEQDVSSLDMVPTSSLPLAPPDSTPAEPPAPPSQPPAADSTPPAPPPPPAPPAKPARLPMPHPALQHLDSPLAKDKPTTSAFLSAPKDVDPNPKKKPKAQPSPTPAPSAPGKPAPSEKQNLTPVDVKTPPQKP